MTLIFKAKNRIYLSMPQQFMDLSIMQKRKIVLQFEENNIFFELLYQG